MDVTPICFLCPCKQRRVCTQSLKSSENLLSIFTFIQWPEIILKEKYLRNKYILLRCFIPNSNKNKGKEVSTKVNHDALKRNKEHVPGNANNTTAIT